MTRPTYYEFFAGGGMAQAGLGPYWNCLFANDFDQMKAATYSANWGADHLVCQDVAKIRTSELPGTAHLVWASFPCQDLSLAGSYLGLGNEDSSAMTRSGTFWPFWALIRSLKKEHRAPPIIVLENVCGVLTSREGKDFSAICAALATSDYRFGAVVIDAERFVPQSRQRVFFIAVDEECQLPENVSSKFATDEWHTSSLVSAFSQLPENIKKKWVWWNPAKPAKRDIELSDLIDDSPVGVTWDSPEETHKLLGMMTPLNFQKVKRAQASGIRTVGCLYKRTRAGKDGVKHQRAEVRFDGVAGCLRTPGGGSSRQTILLINGALVKSRLLSPREAARLMGLHEDYLLPLRYNDAYRVAGDGVCVPVVRHLANSLLEPIFDLLQLPEQVLALTE